MCGICCTVSLTAEIFKPYFLDYTNLQRRGPDSSHQLLETDCTYKYSCFFSGHVLHLRGQLTPQPLKDRNGNIFLWNGEVFGGVEVQDTSNDTRVMFEHITSCDSEHDILSLISKVQGPWAFIYYQKEKHNLWFGRDFFGRRSLLWGFGDNPEVALCLASALESSSLTDVKQWHEVPASGIFKFNLSTSAELKSIHLTHFLWMSATEEEQLEKGQSFLTVENQKYPAKITYEEGMLIAPITPLNKKIPELLSKSNPPALSNSVSLEDLKMLMSELHRENTESFIKVLSAAVKKRVSCLPKVTNLLTSKGKLANVAILFSGGIDSMMLAALADRNLPAEEPIDLLNVAFMMRQNANVKKLQKKPGPVSQHQDDGMAHKDFNPFDVPDRITGRLGWKELKSLNPGRIWNFVEIDVTHNELEQMRELHISQLVQPLNTVLDDSIGCAIWFASRGIGMLKCNGEKKPYTSTSKVIL
ncbi:hypothetical protein GDO81_026252 [Engystomops pustulosus]|uniref:Asparagine synthetase domain-containing protein 1 n=1 Tax=Engystomops pustulosus TaxID=76066 RepID=A0AAV6ZGC8_ENGPU|nr:hypothetical protein GDO81_026252 [Engystomops pustulosus]